VTLHELNALDLGEFVRALGWIFEDSPWVMEQAFAARPFASLDALHKAAVACLEAAPRDLQLALLCSHPDLGTRAQISDASQSEQANAGLGQLTPEEFAHLNRLNAEYSARFGFPFIYAVKNSDKHAILEALERRSRHPPEREFEEALRQVYRIARFRLEDAII
jgi:2-oxo-4-hydroxy-4-carboxy-5-ureidoimidazoline decarboxylase